MSDTFSKIEVISGVARRRRFSTELKLAVVTETFRWRRLMSEGGKEAVHTRLGESP
jgi:transposase